MPSISWMCQVLLLICCVLVAVVVTQRQCPPQEVILPCRCLRKGEEFQIWCSHSDLPNVLEGLRAVGQLISEPIDELILENNYLPSLPGRTFVPLRVVRLMLRYNGLERVSSDWLVGLEKNLVELFLVEPDLRTLPEDSLIRLNSLEAVTIQTNLMKRLPLFSGLPKLRYLQLESLSLIELSARSFKDLPLLETVHVRNSPRLARLDAGVLQDLPRLTLVNISYCGINWMHLRAITRLPVLKELSLVGNKIVDAGMIGRAIRDLPQLEVLKLDHNYIDKIREAAFVDLPSLKKLSLSNNHISEIEYGAFHRVPMLRTLDLNKNVVRRVHPESFLQQSGSGLEELWLIENEISHVADLRSLLDTLPRLTFLDMSYNNLETIPFGALRGHPTLERLHLDFNKIHLIDRESFMAMPALRELRLKNNSLSDILDAPLWNLPSLKGLDLSGNFFRRLEPRLLINLPSLRRIDLSENELTIIDPASFLMSPALEHVNLSRNALSSLHPATFRHLLSLYELDLSYNDLVEFVPNLPRGLEYLHIRHNRIGSIPIPPSPDLDLPSLRMLDISDNMIHKIPTNSMMTLPQLRRLYIGKNDLHRLDENSLRGLSRLEVLDLQDNQLNQIHPNFLKEMSELRELNLKSNRMDTLFPEIFKNIPQLKMLDVSRNQLAEILPGTLDLNREIQVIDASHNFLVQLPPNLSGMKNLKKLDLTDNRLKLLHPGALNNLISLTELRLARNYIQEVKQGAFDNLQHLKLLHLDSNELEVIEPNAIRALPSLKSLKINNNKLSDVPNLAFNNLPSLQTAELQENRIKSIGSNAFHQVPQLLMLNLSHNHLDRLEDAGLRSLKSLEVLDVSDNKISRVTAPNLEKMEWLVELKMDDNNICAIHGSPFDGMPRLRVLSLRNNKMMSLPEQAVQKLRSNIAALDIDGNPLACTCSLLWLQAWLQENSLIGPRCIDGTLLRELRLSRQDCPPEERNAELVAPGCEAELLTAPGTFGTSQVFTQWMKLKSNITKANYVENKNHLAPSPEESEYFYDDYVDYPYNETGALALNNDKKESNTLVTTPKIETTPSPHYTVGDTPTIYAGSSKNKTKSDIPKEVLNSPSTSGFTFFGVPLPSLGLKNFWGGGNSRMEDKKVAATQTADRKTAIVNDPPRGGNRGGAVLPNPADVPRGGHSMRISPQSNGFTDLGLKPPAIQAGGFIMGPPNRPEVERGGFVPLLPGSGGFKPIPNPSLQVPAASNTTIKIIEPSTTAKPATISVLSTTTSATISLEPTTEAYLLKTNEFSSMGHPIPTPIPNPSTNLPPSQNVSIELQVHDDVTEVAAKIEEITASFGQTPELETLPNQSKFGDIIDETVSTAPNTKIENVTSSTTPRSGAESDENLALPSNRKDSEIKKVATPLSALLIPGGQQPEYRPAGRPTITKVPSPHVGGRSPLLSNMDVAPISDPLPHNREETATMSQTNTGDSIEMTKDDTNWYFANYNKTNLEPYIGVSEIISAGCQTHFKSWQIMLSSVLTSCAVKIYLYGLT